MISTLYRQQVVGRPDALGSVGTAAMNAQAERWKISSDQNEEIVR
jgi:hypothetical protein